MTGKARPARQRRLYVLEYSIVSAGLIRILTAGSATPSSDESLARIESESNRRHTLLKEYSGSRQYTLENFRFGKHAAVTALMSYRQLEGERYTVVTRSGSDRLNGIIDQVLASETSESLPPENARRQITSANYRVRLIGTEVAAGRSCYIVALSPRIKNRFLIVGKAWVDAGSYAVVRIEGQFAASMSIFVGAPRISEEFIEVNGFWLPGHVRSVASTFLLGQTELDVVFSNYLVGRTPVRAGPPGPAPHPAKSAPCDPREAEQGAGRGPGGTAHCHSVTRASLTAAQ